MELESLKRFNELSNGLEEARTKLLAEQEKYQRQFGFFTDQFNAYATVDDEEGKQKALKAMNIVHTKIDEVEAKLKALDLEPVAQQVLDEAEQKLSGIKEQMSKQWEAIVNSRIVFLEQLKTYGELRKSCYYLRHDTIPAGRILRRNPLNMGYVSGQHHLVIDLSMINDLLKSSWH